AVRIEDGGADDAGVGDDLAVVRGPAASPERGQRRVVVERRVDAAEGGELFRRQVRGDRACCRAPQQRELAAGGRGGGGGGAGLPTPSCTSRRAFSIATSITVSPVRSRSASMRERSLAVSVPFDAFRARRPSPSETLQRPSEVRSSQPARCSVTASRWTAL